MIKNSDFLKNFDDEFVKVQGLSFAQAIKLFGSLWNEGTNLGVLPPKDPLEGIEVDIRIAKVLNSCLKKFSPG
ncbi:MAG: hypothetical protein V2A69_01985 [Pseudomonadota bacterium]